MKNSLFILLISVLLVGFSTMNRIESLIAKQIKNTFSIETYQKKAIEVTPELNKNLPIALNGVNFFQVMSEDSNLGYYYHGQAYGKADYFDFLVVLDADLIVSKVKVLVYREDHGGEIGSKRWLKQFIGISMDKEIDYEKDIVGISGATISVKAMTLEVNKVLKTFNQLSKNRIL